MTVLKSLVIFGVFGWIHCILLSGREATADSSPLLTWTDVTSRSVQMRTSGPVKTKTTIWLKGDVFFLWADGDCEDKSEVRETGGASWNRQGCFLLKEWKIPFFYYIISVFVFPLIWISLTGHHCKIQRWAVAKLMLINEIVVTQESWEHIRGFWASHDRGKCQVLWPSLCLQAWKEGGGSAASFVYS